MLSRRNKLLALGAIVLAALVGFFLEYSTSQTLALAEALEFRRMKVAARDDGTYRFFFVTNRVDAGTEELLDDRFTNERQTELVFGVFDTDIEPTLGIGMLINPSDWFQNEEIRLRRADAVPREDFLTELRGQVDASRKRSLLININGFRERFPSALRKTAFFAHVLDTNTPILVFDWPGNQGSTPRGYLRAQRVARDSGSELADLLRLVTREIQPDRLVIMANSMGGEVVVSAFDLLYQDPEFNDLSTEFSDVVLTAPDVSKADFGARFRDQILALADQLTVYVSSNDQALLMSRVINRMRRLGESTIDPGTLDPSNPDQFDEAAALYDMMEPGDPRLTLVDITPVNRTRNFHNFSLETPAYFDDVYLRLTNEPAPEARALYRVRQEDGREYWVVTQGR